MNMFKLGFTCAVALSATSAAHSAIIISEYVEGGGNNKAIEITNTGASSVDLTGYLLRRYSNGTATPTTAVTFTNTLNAGASYVIANPGGAAGLTSLADETSGNVSHNGDDAYDLFDGSSVVDTFGQIGTDPGSAWTGGGVSTQNKTLVRKSTVVSGDTNGGDAFDPSVEYVQFDQDDFSNLGSHTFVPEPGSLALLGLGGLLIARRRRSA